MYCSSGDERPMIGLRYIIDIDRTTIDIKKISPIFLVLRMIVKIIPIISIENKSPIDEIIIIEISKVGLPPICEK
jgi:hypothetical protein